MINKLLDKLYDNSNAKMTYFSYLGVLTMLVNEVEQRGANVFVINAIEDLKQAFQDSAFAMRKPTLKTIMEVYREVCFQLRIYGVITRIEIPEEELEKLKETMPELFDLKNVARLTAENNNAGND